MSEQQEARSLASKLLTEWANRPTENGLRILLREIIWRLDQSQETAIAQAREPVRPACEHEWRSAGYSRWSQKGLAEVTGIQFCARCPALRWSNGLPKPSSQGGLQ